MMSSPPNSRAAVCTTFSGKSGAVTLPTQAVATPPEPLIELTTPSAASPSRSLTTTWAPCSANNVATARPIPRPEPVTIADLPSSNFILVSILSFSEEMALKMRRGIHRRRRRERGGNAERTPEDSTFSFSLRNLSVLSVCGGELPLITFLLHRKQLVQFSRRGLGAVLAKLESLGVPDSKA